MTDATSPSTGSTIAVSVHGAAGVLDLVVPSAATAVDVAREYAAQTGAPAMPLLQTAVGDRVSAGRSLADAGISSGDVLVATAGVHRPRRTTLREVGRDVPENPRLAALVAGLAAGAAVLAGWLAGRASPDSDLRTLSVGVLLGCALVGSLPLGRHARQRAAAVPAFGAAAAFAALYEPGPHLLPTILASCGLAAAVVAGVSRALSAGTRTGEHGSDEVGTVWIVSGLVVAGVCSLSPLLAWDARIPWTLLVVLAMMAARFVPSLAIDVPDEALLDLDRLAVTAWSARDQQRTGRRGRIVVAGQAMGALVRSASRTVTAASAAILVVTAVSSPLLLASADLDLDRIGARSLVLFAGASLLLAARSYRHVAARALLRLAGLAALSALATDLATAASHTQVTAFFFAVVALGMLALVVAVATGRGWRSVWWARRAEVSESLCGSLALSSAVVAAGLFRRLWEMTS